MTDAPAIPLALATSDGIDSPTSEGACDSRARNRRWPHIEEQATEKARGTTRGYVGQTWEEMATKGWENQRVGVTSQTEVGRLKTRRIGCHRNVWSSSKGGATERRKANE